MKKIFAIVVCVISSVIVKAGDDDMVKAFLFPQFEKGYVVMKGTGARLAAQFNYDMVNDRMVFLNPDSSLTELDIRSVILVSIGERSFIPIQNKTFYEVIKTGNNEYYINHKSKLMSKGRAAGYGSYSQTASINNITSVYSSGYLTHIGYDEKFEGVDQSVVLIKNDKKYEKVISLKGLSKIFKSHETALETFAKENKIKFSKLEDAIAIVEYAFSL